MKVSQFKAGRKIPVKLADGTEFDVNYNPRFFVNENIDFYAEFIAAGENKTGKELTQDAAQYISTLISWIDIQDEEGNDIPPTVDGLLNVIGMDLSSLRAIHQAAFSDMERRANPILQTEGNSSSG